MRKLALAGIAAGLIAANAASTGALAQEAPPPADSPQILDVPPPADPPLRLEAPLPSDAVAPNPRDPYPYPPPPQDRAKPQAPAKPKITGALVAEAGGGVAGGLLAKGVGTAVAGPVGGFAASWIGSSLGGGAVRMVRRWFHRDKPAEPMARQEAAAPHGVDASVAAPEPPPAADGPS